MPINIFKKYIHTYIHTYTRAYINTYIHTYIHTHIHIYVRMYVCKYVRVCARAHVCMWMCLCACVCVCVKQYTFCVIYRNVRRMYYNTAQNTHKYYKCNSEVRPPNHCCRGKQQVLLVYILRVCLQPQAFIIQRASTI